jgi:formate hydrogenlyase subunit 6/NADH:ubiquinone oxidoreductase subunit I
VWQWQGRVSRQLFDSVPFLLRDKQLPPGSSEGPCQHCTYVLRYKVRGGQLYTDSSRRCVVCAWCVQVCVRVCVGA